MKLTTRQIMIIVLTLVTAGFHFIYAILVPLPTYTPLFILNAIGYVTLLVLYFLPAALTRRYHGVVRWLFIVYTAITFVLYFVIIGFVFHPVELLIKLVELVLIGLLFTDKSS